MRRRLFVTCSVLFVGAALIAAWFATDHSSSPARSAHQGAAPSSAVSTASGSPAAATKESSTTMASGQSESQAVTDAAIQPETLVATIRPAGAPGSRTPGGPAALEIPGRWWGAASILPVIDQKPGWVEVRRALRSRNGHRVGRANPAAIGLATAALAALRRSPQNRPRAAPASAWKRPRRRSPAVRASSIARRAAA